MCDRKLIVDEYRHHECPSKITDVITIGILEDFGMTKDRNGDEVNLVKTVKGQILRLVKCEHQIPHNLPDQPTGNRYNITEEGTEPPSSTFIRYWYRTIR